MNVRIKELRIKKGLTQKTLAEKANRSERQIIRIENGNQMPSGTTLKSIATALETTVGYLLYESEEKNLPDIGASKQVRET